MEIEIRQRHAYWTWAYSILLFLGAVFLPWPLHHHINWWCITIMQFGVVTTHYRIWLWQALNCLTSHMLQVSHPSYARKTLTNMRHNVHKQSLSLKSKLVETVKRKVVPYLKFEVFPFTVLQHLIVMKNWQSISSHTVISIWKQINICIEKRERLK